MTVSRVAFLVKTYPKLSETFILGEILGLESRGLPLAIYALQRPTDAIRQDATARVKAPVTYLIDGLDDGYGVLREHLSQMVTQPLRYVGAMLSHWRIRESGWRRNLAIASRLARGMRAAGVTHVHAHFASHPTTIAAIAARLVGGTYSISAHAKDIYVGDPDVLSDKMQGAAFTVTCTGHNHRHLESLARPGTNVHLMYHGIDFRSFAPRPRATEPDTPLILAVGRLRDKKGFATLVAACAVLRDRGRRFRCEIVGYGEEHSRLDAMIRAAGIADRVHLVGSMNHAALIERYQAATLFAAPCRVSDDGDRDGIPNVLLEAMAMELAVVSTPVSGIPEVVHHGETGLIVPPDDVEALVDALARLLVDPALRRALGTAARRRVTEHFDNERNLDTVHGLLTAVTASATVAHAHPEKVYA